MMTNNGQYKWHESSKALLHVLRYVRRIYNFGFAYTMPEAFSALRTSKHDIKYKYKM